MRAPVLALTAAVALTGCFSAPDACRDLALELCTKVDSCDVLPDGADCGQIVEDLEACDRAIGVSSTYDQCREEAGALQCTALQAGAQFPDSCIGAVAVPTSSTGPTRFDIAGVAFGYGSSQL